jgi:CheY-like chemotaxis protein
VALILVAEDDPFYRQMIRSELTAIGHSVFTADNGNTALHQLRLLYQDLHCAMFDIYMPGLTGIDLLDEFRLLTRDRKDRTLPVIVMSCDGTPQTERAVRCAQVAYFLPKPFASAELLQIVREVMAEA